MPEIMLNYQKLIAAVIYWFSKILSYYLSNRDGKYNYAVGRSIDDYVEYIPRFHKGNKIAAH